MQKEMQSARPQSTDENSTHRVLSLDTCGWTSEQIELFRARCSKQMEAEGYTFDERYREGEPSKGCLASC
jgi:hypothetical protein